MPASPARAAAFEILLRVERDQSYASELLHSERNAKLTPGDHGLATELVMGVLRWRALLDSFIAAASSQELRRLDLEVLTALRMAIYQFQFLSRVPVRAAIFDSVELVKSARKRSAAPFVNAVLRKASKENNSEAFNQIQNASEPGELARSSAHPDWLVRRWAASYGISDTRRICMHNQTVPSTGIHVHGDETLQELKRAGLALAPGKLLSSSYRVLSGDVTKTDAYRANKASIQDEASQLVALLVGHGRRLLDCCAAPGGKTLLLAQENPRSEIAASDLHPHRARLLQERIRRSNVSVIAADARNLPFASEFDRILADVPCSGTGTLARNPEIKWRLTTADLLDLQERQIAILKSALVALVPGGRLLYSTCSLEREENEAVVEAALLETGGFNLVDCRTELIQLQRSGEVVWPDLNSLLKGPYLRTIPGVHPCDGFFAAIIERQPLA